MMDSIGHRGDLPGLRGVDAGAPLLLREVHGSRSCTVACDDLSAWIKEAASQCSSGRR